MQLIVYLVTKMNVTLKLFKKRHNSHFNLIKRMNLANFYGKGVKISPLSVK